VHIFTKLNVIIVAIVVVVAQLSEQHPDGRISIPARSHVCIYSNRTLAVVMCVYDWCTYFVHLCRSSAAP